MSHLSSLRGAACRCWIRTGRASPSHPNHLPGQSTGAGHNTPVAPKPNGIRFSFDLLSDSTLTAHQPECKNHASYCWNFKWNFAIWRASCRYQSIMILERNTIAASRACRVFIGSRGWSRLTGLFISPKEIPPLFFSRAPSSSGERFKWVSFSFFFLVWLVYSRAVNDESGEQEKTARADGPRVVKPRGKQATLYANLVSNHLPTSRALFLRSFLKDERTLRCPRVCFSLFDFCPTFFSGQSFYLHVASRHEHRWNIEWNCATLKIVFTRK